MMSFIQSFDTRILDALVARDMMTVKFFVAITEMGGVFFVSVLILCLCIFLALYKRYASIIGILVSVSGAAGTTFLLKELVHRARPDFLYATYIESGFSFPSAHAAISTALYGFCIFLVWRLFQYPNRILATTALILLTLSIAFSRIYLGVHYPSDVLAGLIIGGVFAWIGIVVARKLEEKI